MPPILLQAILECGVERWRHIDPPLASVLAQNEAQGKKPGIYVLDFSDRFGRSPTVEHMHRILDAVNRYLDTKNADSAAVKEAVRIDEVKAKLTPVEVKLAREGARRYLTIANPKAIKTLVTTLRGHTKHLAPTQRLPFVLRDVGYALDCAKRLDNHFEHTNSNLVMGLFEIVTKSDSTLCDLCMMHGNSVCLCFDLPDAAVGEITISVLAQAYVETGKGFNGVEAGRSIESNSQPKVREWLAWQHAALCTGPFRQNVQSGKQRIAAYRTRWESLAS
ncbi:hypothetical protein BAUCODRAFT_159348 [Baudoinia panamericana UAMH 10762]|uniref:Uncharacterized protein n=1 Tax=Baudoinia panamericana (strain UAMH 10762) TaxID=717646 RepID=M2N0Y0_BAUPA|nr:uncharacterized protein BAUCODRAFT_159348 [Baudoinia panamericana UAMH 10762]EMC92559.1 hypothetical protein BAUCODRAFT_159348 [Baudoinia panamericana UAMH 10762]